RELAGTVEDAHVAEYRHTRCWLCLFGWRGCRGCGVGEESEARHCQHQGQDVPRDHRVCGCHAWASLHALKLQREIGRLPSTQESDLSLTRISSPGGIQSEH